jgi:ubiquinone/menaquinone biosynthesis C-methylase UbiE
MSEKRVDTTRLQRFARAYTESAVFFAALDLELFTHVAQGQDTEEKLAAAMDISALNTNRLVTACLAMGLLEWQGDRLGNAPDAQRFLVKGAPTYGGPWMLFTRSRVMDWFKLTDSLRDKTPPSTLGMYEDLTVEAAREYHAATYSIGMGAGRRFCKQVDLSRRAKLLDLGGGSGAYSINAVKTYPNLKAVVLDLPPVIEVTKEYLAGNGVADRVSTLAGDFTKTEFPNDVDAIVMASNLPIYNEEVIQQVIQKAHDALLPGGEMHLVGEMVYDDRTGPLDSAMWGISEATSGSAGKAHTIGQCVGYFETAGFVQVTDEVFVPNTLHRVTGIKAE